MDARPLLSATDIIRNAQRKITADIHENVRRTEQLTKFCEDYSRLDTTLSTLADQTSHPLMVPLGPLAFMPGRAVHTNEVFVLLGENYFVERSTKQAREIIDRRLTVLKEEVKTLNEEYEAMRLRLGMTEEMQQGHDALGVGNVVDIREEYTSDDEDKDERLASGKQDVPAPRVAKSVAAAAADDAEEERRMARLMELLALEEEEERREKAQAQGAQQDADKATASSDASSTSEPHGTKRPKSCLKGDSLDHVNKSVRIMAPGEAEAKPPSAYPQQRPPIATGFNSAFTGAVVERAVEPPPELDSLFFGYTQAPQHATSSPVPVPTPAPAASVFHQAPPLPSSVLATSPVGPSSFAYAMPAQQQQPQQPQQPQQYYQQPSLMTLNDGSGGIVSLTVLGSGTGPAHTIPVVPQQLAPPQQQSVVVPQHHHHVGSPPPVIMPFAAASSPVEPHRLPSPPSVLAASSSSSTASTTTHKRAFSDSPVVERRTSVGGDPFSPIGVAPSAVERPSVVGSAFSGTILEREPTALAPQAREEDTVQPPKKMSRFRAMRSGDKS